MLNRQGIAAEKMHLAESPLSPQHSALRTRTEWRRAARTLARNRVALAGLVVIVAFALVAVLADVLAPYPFTYQDTSIARQGVSAAHWLGTDELGRDMLSRLMQGARISLAVGVVAQVLILMIGVPLGALAGYFGRWVDALVSRAIDVLFSFPDLLLIIVVVTSLKAALKSDSAGVFGLLAGLDAAFGGLLGVFISLALVSWL